MNEEIKEPLQPEQVETAEQAISGEIPDSELDVATGGKISYPRPPITPITPIRPYDPPLA